MSLPLDPTWTDAIWRSPFRLRFQLSTAGEKSDGGNYINMFASSFDRARELARAALGAGPPLAIVADFAAATWKVHVDENERAFPDSFAALADMGVPTNGAEAIWSGYFDPGSEQDGEAVSCEHRAVRVTWDQADILLWNNIAQEIGVRPRAPLLSKLVDRGRGIVVDAYDDRGMDITALSSEPIEHLYQQYGAWLLDYDLPRMTEAFGPPPARP
jgi:hypothetical protein